MAEKKCLFDSLKSNHKFSISYLIQFMVNVLKGYGWGDTVSYWSAGSNDGINCERTWGWCPDSTAIASDLWNPTEPNSPFGEQCAAWLYNPSDYSRSGIYDLSCSSSQRFICEVIKKTNNGLI